MSITSANAVFTVSQTTLFPSPVQLQQFAVDDAFDTEMLTIADTMMGVDGYFTGGFVWEQVKMSITLMGDSSSFSVFNQIYTSSQVNETVYPLTATITLQDLNLKWNMTQGIVTSVTVIPPVKKLIQPAKYNIEWGKVVPANI